MELNKEPFDMLETVCDAQLEIPVEAEIVLADYLPHVFKIIKCLASVVVLQKQAGSSRLMLEGYIRCEVFYQAEENGGISQTEQKVPFTKYADMRENNCRILQIDTDGDTVYLNARAASETRIVLRGACMLHVKALGTCTQEILCGAAENSTFGKTGTVMADTLLAQQEKVVVTETVLPFARTPKAVLSVQMHTQKEEIRTAANRTLYTGSLIISAVCTDEAGEMLQTQASYPLSEAMTFEELQEDDLVGASVTPLGCTVQERTREKGPAEITATVNLLLSVYVYRKKEQTVLQDIFSSESKLTTVQKPFVYYTQAQKIQKTYTDAQEISMQAEPLRLLFAMAKVTQPALMSGALCGKVTVYAFCQTENEGIEASENTQNYTVPLEDAPFMLQQACAAVADIRADINGGSLRIQTDVILGGVLLHQQAVTVVSDAQEGEKWEPQNAVPLYIYYPQTGESMYDIAKRYHISPQAISALNTEYSPEKATEPVLIPGIRE